MSVSEASCWLLPITHHQGDDTAASTSVRAQQPEDDEAYNTLNASVFAGSDNPHANIIDQ